MSRTCLKFRNQFKKYKTQIVNRCLICGRARGYFRSFKLCRICLRDELRKGNIYGYKKSSW